MARKSIASLSVAPVHNAGFPPAPAGLGDRGTSLWTEIVLSYPTKHFSAADLVLLEQFVRCSLVLAVCDNEIAENGVFIETNQGLKAHPALAVRDAQIKNQATLATKLRLPVSSRLRADSAKARPGESLVKPWESALVEP